MRRLGRNIFRVVTAFLLILWLGLLVLWLRSYWRGDSYLRDGHTFSWLLVSSHGGICVAVEKHPPMPAPALTQGVASAVSPEYPEPGMHVRSLIAARNITFTIPASGTSTSGTSGAVTIPNGQAAISGISVASGSLKVNSGATTRTVVSGTSTTTSPTTGPGTFTLAVNSATLSASANTGSVTTYTGSTLVLVSGTLTFVQNYVISDGYIPTNRTATTGSSELFHAFTRRVMVGAAPSDAGVLILPHWAALLVLAIPVACFLWINQRISRRAKWLREGWCVNCGYDLRATPDRCPECGAVTTAAGAL